MGGSSRGRRWATALLAAVAAAAPATRPAADPLAGTGLTRAGSVLVLGAAEADVRSAVRALRAAKAKLATEASVRRDFDRKRKAAAAGLAQLDAESDAVNRAELAAKDDDIRNKYIAQNNLLVTARRRQQELIDALAEQGQKLNDSRSDYVRLGLEASDAAAAMTARYAALAADPAVVAALKAAGPPAGRSPLRLGPSADAAADLRFLAVCRSDFVTASVPVVRDGGVPTVDVVLNGRAHLRMIWDSGASLVSLSAKAAAEAGMRPTAGDPKVVSRIANGQTVTEHRMVIGTVQVGSFVAHDVPCTVGPPGQDEPLLLGDAFQDRFLCRLDPAAGKLFLSPLVATTEPARPAGGPGRPAPPHAWVKPPPPKAGLVPGLVAQLYSDPDFKTLVKTRVDRQLMFDWGSLGPDPAMGGGRFSLRWAGQLRVQEGGTYTLQYFVDDTLRVRIDDKPPVVDAKVRTLVPATVDVPLAAGNHPITVEYRNEAGIGRLDLQWALKGGFAMQPLQRWALVHKGSDEPTGTEAAGPGWRTEQLRASAGDGSHDDAPAGLVLVGFDLTVDGEYGHRNISSLTPLYGGGPGEAVPGQTYGKPTEDAHRVLARPGYAVAAVAVQRVRRIEGLVVHFAHLGGDGPMDAADAYDAARVGGNRHPAVVLGEDRPIVGVYGSADADHLCSLGLVERD